MKIKENPYIPLLDEITNSMNFHNDKYREIVDDYFSSGVENNLKNANNNYKSSLLLGKDVLSKDEIIVKETMLFDISFYQNKVDLYQKIVTNIKKTQKVFEKFSVLIENAINEYKTIETLAKQYSEEEISNDPKLSKMLNYKPVGFDNLNDKFLQLGYTLLKLEEEYLSLNTDSYFTHLKEHLNLAMQNNKEVKRNIIIEDKEESLKNHDITISNKNEYESIKAIIEKEDNVSDNQLLELRHFLSLFLAANELSFFSGFEHELINDFNRVTKRNENASKSNLSSVDEFVVGINNILDIYNRINDYDALIQELDEYVNKFILSVSLEEFIKHPEKLNQAIGAVCFFLKAKDERKFSSFFFRHKKQQLLEEEILQRAIKYLVDVIGIDPSIISKTSLANLSTGDKKNELKSALNNIYVSLRYKDSIIQRDNIGLNKQIATYMIKAIDEVINGGDVFSIADDYHDQKLERLLALEMKSEQDAINVEPIEKDIIKHTNRVEYDKVAAKNAIRGNN